MFRWAELPLNDWVTLNAKLRFGFAQAYANAEMPVQTVTTSGTPSHTAQRELVLVNTTAGNVTVTLPTAASRANQSQVYKKIAAGNTMTLDGAGTETIDGALTLAVTTLNQAVEVMSDGTKWLRLT
jgi:hypothetical protein